MDSLVETDTLDMNVKLKELTDAIKVLEGEKLQIQEEFGVQRAKMREIYLQKEDELQRQSARHEHLLEEIKKLNSELDEAKSQLVVAGLRMECEQEVERKCQEEIATLQQIVQETFEESTTSRSKYENEVKQLRHFNERLEAENQDLRCQLQQGAAEKGERDSPSLAPGVMLSAVTKTFARKVASQLGADASSISQDNLEDSMRKVNKYAQEDAEVLRSLVIPLEEEIQALKEKIRLQDEQLRKYQGEKDEEKFGDMGRSVTDGDGAYASTVKGIPASKSGSLLPKMDQINLCAEADNQFTSSQAANITPKTSSVNSITSLSSVNGTGSKMGSDSTKGVNEDNDKLLDSFQDKTHESLLQEYTSVNTSLVGSAPQSPCDMCCNYEAQLVKSQQQAQELRKQLSAQEKTLQRYRDDLAKESEFRKEMEEKWNEKKEEHKMQVAELRFKMQAAEEALNELRQTYSQTITEVTDQLMRLSQNREKVEKELQRLQKENEDLVGKHSAHSQQLQNEMINLPDKVEDLQELLLKFHEELIVAKVAKESAEEQEKTLRCENQLLRVQMSVEQEGRENMEDNLTSELLTLKTKLETYERDRQFHKEKQEQMEPIIETNKRLVEELKTQVTDAHKAKTRLENEVAELRGRVTSLQQDLYNAETVQQDFVRLSQSLQVQLEKIRGSDSQVRWEHDDDIEECPTCRNSFTVTRRKQHCRHCGRIFCSNCLPHSVPSGPNQRPSRVCGVCHTLLVKDTAPYFSTEPPHTPD